MQSFQSNETLKNIVFNYAKSLICIVKSNKDLLNNKGLYGMERVFTFFLQRTPVSRQNHTLFPFNGVLQPCSKLYDARPAAAF